MKIRIVVGVIANTVLGGSIVRPVAAESAPAEKPNILIIVADDMGFSDVGCYGGEIQTPNLDCLANGGRRFTQFYNTARSWSSRASLLTDYYAQSVRRDLLPEIGRGEYGMFGMESGFNGVRPRWAQMLPAGFDHSYSLEDNNRFFAPKDQ